MRILTVCSSFRVFGAETITLKMLEGFKRNGHEQLAITSIWSDGDFSQRLRKLGIREEVMPFGAVVASFSPRYLKWTLDCLIRLPVLWWKWNRSLEAFKPDIVLWTSSKQPLLLLPGLNAIKSVLIEYTNAEPTRNMLWLHRQLARKLSGFVAVSSFMRGHLHSLGAPLEKIRVVKSGAFFDEEFGAINKTDIGTRQGGRARIGIVGQVAPNKGHDCLVEAVRILGDRGVDLTIEVFGDGSPDYVMTLKQEIERHGLSKIWNWNGYKSDKDKIFRSIDACVVPSCFGDPFPTTAMEAGAYGLPVIASRVGGLPEIIEDGITGWLIEPNAPNQLADRIQELIENPEQASRAGAAARVRIRENFAVERMISEFEKLFGDLCVTNE